MIIFDPQARESLLLSEFGNGEDVNKHFNTKDRFLICGGMWGICEKRVRKRSEGRRGRKRK